MRWLPRSLHARMLALSLAATLVALGVAGWAITGLLERFVMQGLDRRLDGEVALLASSVDANGRIDRDRLRQRLGALDSGPGWRWQIVTAQGTIGSTDFPPLYAGPPPPPGPHEGGGPAPPVPPGPGDNRMHPLEGGSEQGVRVHARQLRIETRGGPVTLTAAAPRSVVQRPIRGAVVPLLAALAALGALLTAATLVQLRLGLRPLRRLRDQVAAIRTGAADHVDEDQPAELIPLAMELNALTRASAATLATARATAANLAHALKTPVAALAVEVRDEPTRAAQVARIDATIRHHLARARATAVNHRGSTAVAPAVEGLFSVLDHTARDRGIILDAVVMPELTVAVEATDLDELIGNLLDNAVRHATRRVLLNGAVDRQDARRVSIEIVDDGPGISDADRTRAIAPGVRLDERIGGHGFGLSIVNDLVALYGGELVLTDAPAGGLVAGLILPAATPQA